MTPRLVERAALYVRGASCSTSDRSASSWTAAPRTTSSRPLRRGVVVRVGVGQRGDVGSCAETASGTGEHDGPDLGVVVGFLEQREVPVLHGDGPRVEPVRPVERQHPHGAAVLDEDFVGARRARACAARVVVHSGGTVRAAVLVVGASRHAITSKTRGNLPISPVRLQCFVLGWVGHEKAGGTRTRARCA